MLQTYCGECNWLATKTHPDISYYISVIAQGTTKYAQWCLNFCKKVVRYLASTWDQGITFVWAPPVGAAGLVSWSDASFAGYSTKSQTGVLIAWAGSVVLWRSSRQSSSALSTCEAEVSAAATSWQIVEGLRTLLNEWDVDVGIPILLVDNKSALRVSELGGTWRTRYFAIRAARLAEESAEGRVSLRYCPTGDMAADGLTKTAAVPVMQKLRDCCDGNLPPIPDTNQSFRECKDKATWWGKGLDVEFVRASLAKIFKSTRCRPVQHAAEQQRASAASPSPLPPRTPQSEQDRALALGRAMLAAMQGSSAQ